MGAKCSESMIVNNTPSGAYEQYTPEPLLSVLARTMWSNHPNDRQDQQTLADLKDRGREFTNGLLLLADDPFTFLDKADRHRVGDTVGGRLIGIKDAVELPEIALVFGEQRAG